MNVFRRLTMQRTRSATHRLLCIPLLACVAIATVPKAGAQEGNDPGVASASQAKTEPSETASAADTSGQDQAASVEAETNSEESKTSPAITVVRRRHALILVGLPGDDEHRQLFDQTTESWRTWLTQIAGVKPQDVTVMSATGTDSDPTFPTAENLSREITQLGSRITETDALWVFWLGHGSQDGQQVFFHLPGPDLDATQWSALFAGITARQQVFWLTHAASGGFMKAMSSPGRIVIAATDSGAEVNETRFPHLLAELMRGQLETAEQSPSESKEPPDDVLALFLATARQVLAEFESANLAPTEHAQLDDNGDGKGTELDGLDDETLGQVNDPSLNLDGVLAHQTSIPLLPENSQAESGQPESVQPESDTKKASSPDDSP